MKEKWCLLKLLRSETPYLASATQHFVGKVITLQELGKLSNKAVEKIRRALGYNEEEDIRIDTLNAALIPLDELPASDRELLERHLVEVDHSTILIIKECKD